MKNSLKIAVALISTTCLNYAAANVTSETTDNEKVFLTIKGDDSDWSGTDSASFINDAKSFAKTVGTRIYLISLDDTAGNGVVICLSKSSENRKLYRSHSTDIKQKGAIDDYDSKNGINHKAILNDNFLKLTVGQSFVYKDGDNTLKAGVVVAKMNPHALCYARVKLESAG
jgi:hypothetical protein